MVITGEWQKVAESVAKTERRPLVVMVVGAVDTGKTTFCTYLARTLFEAGFKVAVVDADLGQSDIGLPTTIGMGFVSKPIERLRDVNCQASYFVGSISPVGFLLPTVTGTKLMTERALALGAEAVVIDTDGLVHGGAGVALKQYTFELLRPTHVVLLQRANELSIFKRQWEGIVWTKVLPVPVPETVSEKTREQRRQFREQRFREWLSECGEVLLPLSQLNFRNAMLRQGIVLPQGALQQLSELMGTKVLYAERVGDNVLIFVEAPLMLSDFSPIRQFFGGAPYIRWTIPSRYEQIVVGLLDANDELLTVGLTFRLDFSEGILSVLSPPVQVERVRTIVFGALRLALDGTELGTISPGSL
ncbi:MAG: Clp1/GlmU family protein [Armatimonadetes bacterium]|nr:Clp1/GlmU family protein [Armatimonadota bacterium]